MTCNSTKFKGKFKDKKRLALRKLHLDPRKSCDFYFIASLNILILNFFKLTNLVLELLLDFCLLALALPMFKIHCKKASLAWYFVYSTFLVLSR